MRSAVSHTILACGLAAGLLLNAGCPSGLNPTQYIAGGTGQNAKLGTNASVKVLAPQSDLSISGGTPIQVSWQAIATSNFASINVIFDVDNDPNNGNEIFAQSNVSLTTSTATLDTSLLAAGSYSIGVVLIQANEIVAFGYSAGQVSINQRPLLVFTSPRDNFAFDRNEDTAPRFDVTWTLDDPDSTVTTQIFLDPDASPNGNEILLRESSSQTGDTFSFNLPTISFTAGTYRILAVVSDGVAQAFFYAPASIRLRSRYAGVIDLRNLGVEGANLPGAIFEGVNPRDNGGSFVSALRDIDNDGFDDFIIMSQFAKPNYNFDIERVGVGEAYIIYGRNKRFAGNVSLNSVGALFRGDIFTGALEVPDPVRPSRGISSFALLADWDGDGLHEMAFGLPFTDSVSVAPLDADGYFRSGAVVLAAGSTLAPPNFPGASGTNIHALDIIGTLPHEPGDLLPKPCPEGLYGPKSPSSPVGSNVTYFHRHLADVNLANILYLGCRFSTNEFNDQCGETVSSYEFNSIMISVPNANAAYMSLTGPNAAGAGAIITYFNSSETGFYPWSNVAGPEAGGTYPGTPQSQGVGLIPHGGPYHYILADSRGFAPPGTPPTSGLLFPGSPGFTVDADDSEPCQRQADGRVPDFSTTTRVFGTIPGGRLSNAVAIDDFNRDGIRDYLLGNPLARDGAGACYVVFGRLRDLVIGGELSITELDNPMNSADPNFNRIFDSLRIVGGAGDRLGQSQDQAGDFNGDGSPDVIIGSPLLSDSRGGAAVVFGSRDAINLTQNEIPFGELPARGLGVIFLGQNPNDLAGARVAGVGDIDGDGVDDIMIAAPAASVRADVNGDGVLDIDRTNCGVVYLIYGSSKLNGTLNLADVGTEKLPGAVFVGRNSGDFLGGGLGLQGDRAHGIARAGDIDGDGRVDLLISSVSATPRDRVAAGESYLIYGAGD